MAPVILALEKDRRFQSRVCVTGQHRQLLDEALRLFDIRPDWDLNLMRPDQDLADLTAAILLRMREVLREEQPDIVLVHGDTTTCFGAALAAFNQGVAIGHVEAGLRTWNLRSPFPEEANRTLVSRLANYNYAPTCQARDNLRAEGISATRIEVTGNTVIDALLAICGKVNAAGPDRWRRHFGGSLGDRLVDPTCRKVLITSHRRENFGPGLIEICSAIHALAAAHPSCEFVFPVHPNPNVQKPVTEILGDEPNVWLIAPQSYEAFVWLMSQSDLILTDSGGIQEEALSLGKPLLVIREATERPEALQSATVRLIGASRARITETVAEHLQNPAALTQSGLLSNPFGDGLAAQRIVEHLARCPEAIG